MNKLYNFLKGIWDRNRRWMGKFFGIWFFIVMPIWLLSVPQYHWSLWIASIPAILFVAFGFIMGFLDTQRDYDPED